LHVDETGPLEIAVIEDIVLVADENSEPNDAIVDPLSPFSGIVELPGENALVIDGLAGLRLEETEVMGSTDDTPVDPPAANSLAAAGLIQKLAVRRARAFNLIEHIMVVLDPRICAQWRANMRGD
jgi:hypothetical protein